MYYYDVSLSATSPVMTVCFLINSQCCPFTGIILCLLGFFCFSFLFVCERHGLQMYIGATLINFMMIRWLNCFCFCQYAQKKSPSALNLELFSNENFCWFHFSLFYTAYSGQSCRFQLFFFFKRDSTYAYFYLCDVFQILNDCRRNVAYNDITHGEVRRDET